MWRVWKDSMKDQNSTRCVPYTTKSGLQIGANYNPPMQQLTREGEDIQALLLGLKPTLIERNAMPVYMVVLVIMLILLALMLRD